MTLEPRLANQSLGLYIRGGADSDSTPTVTDLDVGGYAAGQVSHAGQVRDEEEEEEEEGVEGRVGLKGVVLGSRAIGITFGYKLTKADVFSRAPPGPSDRRRDFVHRLPDDEDDDSLSDRLDAAGEKSPGNAAAATAAAGKKSPGNSAAATAAAGEKSPGNSAVAFFRETGGGGSRRRIDGGG